MDIVLTSLAFLWETAAEISSTLSHAAAHSPAVPPSQAFSASFTADSMVLAYTYGGVIQAISNSAWHIRIYI
jgi:hypothetical protein